MKRRFIVLFALFFAAVTGFAPGQEETRTEPLIFTAERMPLPESKLTANVTVVTREDIESSGAQSIGELLQGYAGLTFQQHGGMGKASDIRVRGSKSSHVLMLLNGYRINSPASGAVDLSSFSLDDVERIEVARGGASSLYGSEGVNGVINIITRRPSAKPVVMMKSFYGTYSTSEESLTASGMSGGGAGYHLFFNNVESDGLRVNDDYRRRTLSAGFSLGGEDLSYDADVRWIESRNGLSIGWADALDEDNRVNEHLFFGSFSVNRKWSETRKVTAKLYGTSDTTSYLAPHPLFPEYGLTRAKTNGIDVQYNLRLRKTDVVAGAQYEEIRGATVQSSAAPISENWNLRAAFVNTMIPLGNDSNLAAGARVDDYSTFGSEFTTRITLTRVLGKTSASVSWGKNFHAPTFNDLYYPASLWAAGNPDLKPEYSTNREINFRFQPSSSLRFDLCGFSYRYKKMIKWVETAPWFYQPSNASRAKIAGVEAGAVFYPGGNVEYSLNYTHLNSMDYDTGREINRAPSDQLDLTISFRGGSRWGWTLRGRHVSSIDNSSSNVGIDGYTVIDGRVEFNRSPRFTYFLEGNNLLDNDYKMMGSYPAPGISLRFGVAKKLR
ncbi:MAG: TonB-dependent receptor [bacterium]